MGEEFLKDSLNLSSEGEESLGEIFNHDENSIDCNETACFFLKYEQKTIVKWV